MTVTVPEDVLCPATVTLSANASDRDGDLDEVRWTIGDTLIAPGVTQVEFYDFPTEFKAVARDDRGAATSDSAIVSCIPI